MKVKILPIVGISAFSKHYPYIAILKVASTHLLRIPSQCLCHKLYLILKSENSMLFNPISVFFNPNSMLLNNNSLFLNNDSLLFHNNSLLLNSNSLLLHAKSLLLNGNSLLSYGNFLYYNIHFI